MRYSCPAHQRGIFCPTMSPAVACLFYDMLEAPDMTEPRSIRDRFPAPWRAERTPGGYRVLDRNDTPLVHVYAASDEERRQVSSQGLTPAEARAIAQAIAALPTRPA